jgi:hypothetical protein
MDLFFRFQRSLYAFSDEAFARKPADRCGVIFDNTTTVSRLSPSR